MALNFSEFPICKIGIYLKGLLKLTVSTPVTERALYGHRSKFKVSILTPFLLKMFQDDCCPQTLKAINDSLLPYMLLLFNLRTF